jgi:hypothetical protein
MSSKIFDPKGLPEGTIMRMGKKQKLYQLVNKNWKIISDEEAADHLEQALKSAKIVINSYREPDQRK